MSRHACHPSSYYAYTVHCLMVYLLDPTVTNTEGFIRLTCVPVQTPCQFAGCIRHQQHIQTGCVCCFSRAGARTGQEVGNECESRAGWLQMVQLVYGGAHQLDRQGELELEPCLRAIVKRSLACPASPACSQSCCTHLCHPPQ